MWQRLYELPDETLQSFWTGELFEALRRMVERIAHTLDEALRLQNFDRSGSAGDSKSCSQGH